MSDLAESTTDPLVDVLTKHFVMWHDLDGPLAAEWRCACGRTFAFSDAGIAHVAAALSAAGYAQVAELLRDRTDDLQFMQRLQREEVRWRRASTTRSLQHLRHVMHSLARVLDGTAGKTDEHDLAVSR